MLTRPIFKPHLSLAIVPDEGVFLLSGSKQAVLRGRLYELVAPHVGGRTADEICDRLSAHASSAEVYFTLAQFEKKGCLAESNETLPQDDSAWWSFQQIDPSTASRRLQERRIAVHGIGIDTQPLRELLEAAGARVDTDGELSVVVVDHYLRSEIAAFNDAALASGRPWLLAKPLGVQLWLGPLFHPGTTGCWTCLAERLRANRAVECYLRERQTLVEPLVADCARTSAVKQAAWGLTANAIASWIVRGELPDCEGQVRTFDQLSWQTKTHTLVKLPYCPACGGRSDGNRPVSPKGNGDELNVHQSNGHQSNGHQANGQQTNAHQTNGHLVHGHEANPAVRCFRPPIFESRKKTQVRDGGHRVVPPEETLKRFGHHVSAITGAVSMLERASGAADGAMHVYLAGQNVARRHQSLGQLRGDLRNMSSGKGTTDVQARASGLCEGLERHSGIFRGDEPRQTARLADLGAAGIDLRDCLLFSERQYHEREITNSRPSRFNFVPQPFDPDSPIEWSPVWSLSRQEVRYLPTAFCYYDYPLPRDQRYCVACSNGNAAGNTLEEAILQGLFELVERDSVALWWYNRVSRPGVDLISFHEPYLQELADCLATHDREMCVLDLTSDLQIPVFAAWSRRTPAGSKAADGAEQIVFGFGAHLDAKIALLRAVTEMNQMLSYLLQAPPDKVYSDHVTDLDTVHWLKTATVDNQPYLVPAADARRRTAKDYNLSLNDDVTQDVYDCQRLVERQGLEMLVLDQTRPEIGLPVVKVIVPGLRHFWARFAPGRLYQAPVKLGWLEQPVAEEDLNPIPMFL
jgi:bacteriocin biosynthesis cyclodehydratase domain-containing protein